jgi:serine/threonine protein kinase
MHELSKQSRELAQTFESIWTEDPPANIESFFNASEHSAPIEDRLGLLLYLVQIDLEMRRRTSIKIDLKNPGFGYYASLFPELLSTNALFHLWDKEEISYQVASHADGQLKANARNSLETATTILKTQANKSFIELPEIPGFVVLNRIGKGGMGAVFSAIDPLGREVAVKLILDEIASPEANGRFKQEARILASLDSELILPIYNFGNASFPKDVPYYSMRKIRGAWTEVPVTLATLITNQDESNLCLETRIRIFKGIACSVALAHEQKNPILHRDLKPSNILIDESLKPWLIDWGLAKSVLTEVDLAETDTSIEIFESPLAISQRGIAVGTPAYMAPEQARGDQESVSTRTDVFGLGGVLFFILTGRHPYQGKSTAEVLSNAANYRLRPALDELEKNADPIIFGIVQKCMAKDPASRYANGKAVVEAIDFWFDTQDSIRNQKDIASWQEPTRRFARKLLLGVICLILALAGVFTWRMIERNQQAIADANSQSDNQQKIQSELDLVASAIGKRDIDEARRHLSTANRLTRVDTPKETIARITETTGLFDLAVYVERIREERILLRLDANISDQQLNEFFLDAEKTLFRLKSSLIDSDILAGLRVDLQWERYKFEPSEDSDLKLKKLARSIDANYVLQLEQAQATLSQKEIDRIIAESLEVDISPAWLDSLLMQISNDKPVVTRVFQKLDETHPHNFWINLYRAVSLASIPGENVDETQRLHDEATLWASFAYAIKPQSPVATLVYASLLDASQEAQLANLNATIGVHAKGSWIESYVQAKYHISRSDSRLATECMLEAVKRKEDDPFLKLQLAAVYIQFGDVESASKILESDFFKRIDTAQSHFLKMIVCVANGKFSEFEDQYTQFSKKFKGHPLEKRATFLKLFIRGRFVDAAQILDSMSEPEKADYFFQVFSFLVDHVRGEHNQNKNRCQMIARIDKSVVYYQFTILTELAAGNVADADSLFKEFGEQLQSNSMAEPSGVMIFLQLLELKRIFDSLILSAECGTQIESVEKKDQRALLNTLISSRPFGKAEVVYAGEYFRLRRNYVSAIDLYETIIPPGSSAEKVKAESFSEIQKAAAEKLGFQFTTPEEFGIQFAQLIGEATQSETKFSDLMEKLKELMDNIDVSTMSDLTMQSNLRVAAARCCCLAAAGASSVDGSIGNDFERERWRELAIKWIDDELNEIESHIKNLDSFPHDLRYLRKTGLSARLSFLLLNRDLACLRNASQVSRLSNELQAKINQLWAKTSHLYNSLE